MENRNVTKRQGDLIGSLFFISAIAEGDRVPPDLDLAIARWAKGHADGGTIPDYRKLLADAGMDMSMSHKGDCWDNAVMESFWSTLKTEEVHHRHYATRDQARASIFEYIEVFYNRKRLHSALGYQSPEAFEAGLN